MRPLRDLDSWDLTGAFTGNLVARPGHAWAKAAEGAGRKKPFEKRAAFSLMAAPAAQDKAAAGLFSRTHCASV